jgi:hypothetical protein
MNKGQMRAGTLLAGLFLVVALGGCLQPVHPVMSPPAWIIGEWGFGVGEIDAAYEFTATTMIQRTGSMSMDWAEICRNSGMDVEEIVTASLYSFTIQQEQGSMSYEFRKGSSDSISMTMRANGVSIGPLVLYRQ